MFFWKGLSISIFTSFFLFFFCLWSFSLLCFILFDFSSMLVDWQFFVFCGFEVNFSVLVDWISVSFSMVVFLISFSVIWFSYYYMEGDFYVFRFTWLVVLFVMSMVFLIFIPNLIALLIGWDGLGLISFCLVIYYQNFKSLVSGVVTVLMNRVGDVMILLSIGWLVSFGSWNCLFLDEFYCSFFVCLCLVLAGMTKSAQFPFCSWLPAAMAAPTPVSALVHSSTLVTAGVYLIIRFWDFISFSFYVVLFLQLISLLTMVLSGFSAMFETDLKKIIALSTLSQLSVMLFAVSFGFGFLGLFHLYTHALFKALLFLCAGCLIHSFSHVQDLRHLGSCWSLMPCVMVFMNLANLALCGFPFFGGFYSKDVILEMFLFGGYNFFLFFIVFFATSLTVGYSVRLILFSSFGAMKMVSLFNKGEEDWNFLFPLFVLGLGALFGGFFFYSFVFWVEMFFFFFLVFLMKTLFFCSFFWFFCWLYFFFFSYSESYSFSFVKFISSFGGTMWFLQLVTTQGLLNYPFCFFFYNLYVLDRGYFELFGGQCVLMGGSFSSSFLNLVSFKSIVISASFLLFVVVFFYF
uniref:NADH-ubiquinone oxidoreductase chain 5 n=1 Tax=Prosadenoporus spectaculum TaxID=1332185 RepID=X2CBV4_9BILA|nr:NADH dehydrogenase subunit 5 [Prosadenoporus spectaculum]AGL46779.1 NADH dehydrogenase subunit 5 [Prosadenoporus spectaculum]